jgi:hypothetical protein
VPALPAGLLLQRRDRHRMWNQLLNRKGMMMPLRTELYLSPRRVGRLLSSSGIRPCVDAQEGAVSAMQCVIMIAGSGQTSGNAGALGFNIQYTFTATVLGNLPTNNTCAALDAQFTRWMRYSAFHGCTPRLLTSTVGTVTCTVVVPRCVAGEHLVYLLALLDAQQEPIAAAIRQCTSSPMLVLGAPLIQEVPFLPTADAFASDDDNHDAAHARPRDAPRLMIQRRKWGQTHLETLDTLVVVVIALLGLTVGCASACALAFARAHRRSVMRRAFALLGLDRWQARLRRRQRRPHQQHRAP